MLIILLLLNFSCSFHCVRDDDNPFELVHTDENFNHTENDDDPFSLVHKRETRNITVEEFKSDLLAHIHLVKILWNRFISQEIRDKNKFPSDVFLRFTVTKEAFGNIESYINSSNQNVSKIINQNILKNLFREEQKVEICSYEKNPSIFDDRFYRLIVIFLLALMFCYKPWPTVVVIIALGLWHQDWTMRKDSELRQQYEINKLPPSHCDAKNKSTWNKLIHWFSNRNDDECFKYYKNMNSEIGPSVNPINVVVKLCSDAFILFAQPFGELIGYTFKGLNLYMPFYMAYIALFMGFVLILIFFVLICYVYMIAPRYRYHLNEEFIPRDFDQNLQDLNRRNNLYHRLRNTRIKYYKSRKAIGYR